MANVAGLGLSLVYVLAVLVVSSVLARCGASNEVSRKVVHIALGGWWIIASLVFTSALWAALLPAVFIVVNAVVYRTQALSFMARTQNDDTPGTVYYAVSLTVLALFSFGIGAPYVGALGFFCMAFGDGFAAVLGKRYGRRTFATAGKTLVGSTVMFAVSFVSCVVVLLIPPPVGAGLAGSTVQTFAGMPPVGAAVLAAAVLAVAATVLEALSVRGLDNLSVPLGITALFVVLFVPEAGYTPDLVGLLLSGVVTLASLRAQLLTARGALSALAVGTLSFVTGGWPLWLLLMWFFGSSNLASKVMAHVKGGRTDKTARDDNATQKSKPRRARQVLANSVPFLVCSSAYALSGESWLLVVAAGALAASTADTWASEIGVYSTRPPVNILTFKPMQRGLSGGVSPLGLGATVVGAVTSAFLAMLLFHAFGFAVPTGPTDFLFIVACGVAGSLVDSVLGAFMQAKYRSAYDRNEGEELLVETVPRHDALNYVLVSGYAWVTNDAVNFLSGVAVVMLGLLVV